MSSAKWYTGLRRRQLVASVNAKVDGYDLLINGAKRSGDIWVWYAERAKIKETIFTRQKPFHRFWIKLTTDQLRLPMEDFIRRWKEKANP